MFHGPITEMKARKGHGGPSAHPPAGAMTSHGVLSSLGANSRLAELHRAYGNQAMLQMLNHGNFAFSNNIDREVPAGSLDDSPKYSDEGLKMDLDCQNGGGASVCDASTGLYGLVSNDNTCCTRDCTAKHEATHKRDQDAWGCCKAESIALKQKGADRKKIIQQYNDWRDKASPILECHAYTAGMNCAVDLAKSKDCSGKGKGSDCCNDIETFRKHSEDEAKANCDAMPKTVPPCPVFG